MYWPHLIDGLEPMMAPGVIGREEHHRARDFLGLTESIDGNQRLAPCDRSSLVRDQLAVANSTSVSHSNRARARSADIARCLAALVPGQFR
jgi:hypothetical protein